MTGDIIYGAKTPAKTGNVGNRKRLAISRLQVGGASETRNRSFDTDCTSMLHTRSLH